MVRVDKNQISELAVTESGNNYNTLHVFSQLRKLRFKLCRTVVKENYHTAIWRTTQLIPLEN